MTLKVTYPESAKDLYHQYPGQTASQEVYAELDCEEKTLRLDWNGEIGNAVPFSVWHRRILRFSVPGALMSDAAKELLDRITPLAQTVIDGYSCEWDGSNHVGRYTDEAEEACDEIRDVCATVDSSDIYSEWDPADWFEPVSLSDVGLSHESTKEEIEERTEAEVATAASDGVAIDLDATIEFFTEWVAHEREEVDETA
jgi:hypothetical protein